MGGSSIGVTIIGLNETINPKLMYLAVGRPSDCDAASVPGPSQTWPDSSWRVGRVPLYLVVVAQRRESTSSDT